MMQAITYIALLMDTKVYDENNKKISYLKALEKMSVDENYKNKLHSIVLIMIEDQNTKEQKQLRRQGN